MKKIIRQYIIPVFLSMCLTTIGYFFIYGIPLLGIPKTEDISYVEIFDRKLDNSVRRFTEVEDIEKTVNITGFLNYKLGTPKQNEPFIEITFYLKDGTKVSFSANKETVYWNGKAYAIKGDNGIKFVNITEGLLFYDALVENENIQ